MDTPQTAQQKNIYTTETVVSTPPKQSPFMYLIIACVVLGVVTGVGLAVFSGGKQMSGKSAQTTASDQKAQTGAQKIAVGQVFGTKNTSALKDTVEGILVVGGVGSEGSHHLVRPGGESQNVYLSSSVMDLKLFEGARVKVSGETFKGQKAGWLMDAVRLEVLELNAALPESAPAKKTTGQDF